MPIVIERNDPDRLKHRPGVVLSYDDYATIPDGDELRMRNPHRAPIGQAHSKGLKRLPPYGFAQTFNIHASNLIPAPRRGQDLLLRDARSLAPNVRGQVGRAKRVQHARERRSRPCLHRACRVKPRNIPDRSAGRPCRLTTGLSRAGPKALKCKQNAPTRVRSRPLVGPVRTHASLRQAPAGRHVCSNAPPHDPVKPRRGGMCCGGQSHAAPTGLEAVLFEMRVL
jgi:hypothetical protein